MGQLTRTMGKIGAVLGTFWVLGYSAYKINQGNLRMDTQECSGTYTEGVNAIGDDYNRVNITKGDAILELRDYDGNTIDWNSLQAEQDMGRDHVDLVKIKTSSLEYQIFTPADSNSNTLSGQNARDWLQKGDSLYHSTRRCFIDWARRDYLKTHPQAKDFFRR